jgi:hypothetical protein
MLNLKQRKNILRGGIVILVLSIYITGCSPDENNGDVILPRDQFIGTWAMVSHHTDPNQAATQTWDLIIEQYNANSEVVALKNLDQTGYDRIVLADVNGSNLSLHDTTINLNGGGYQTIKGSGSLNGATLHLDYTSFDGIVTDTATASGTK